ncbi:MAG: TetR/AcrR family transcriptional regulator, partial [Solirubrobacterales bacterium]
MAHRVARTTPAVGPTTSKPAPSEGVGVSVTTRERILDVALDLFVRKGYAETSLREIAAELGFSKAALYYHFESKQDILLALHRRVHSLTDGVLPLLQAEADAGDTWERLVDLLIGLALQNRRLIELHARNQEAIAELHRNAALEKHG